MNVTVARASTLASPPALPLGRTTLHFDRKCLIMGIVNATPDSFADGGQFSSTMGAVEHALNLIAQGADMVDVGGESTRPFAAPVALQEELDRVIPVIAGIRRRSDAVISVDTSKAAVAREALLAGADLVNDVSALEADPQMAPVVAEAGAGLVLMHMRGTPRDMQQNLLPGAVIDVVCEYLSNRVAYAVSMGVLPERIALDPGIGFGKSVAQNYELVRELHRLRALGHAVLLGTSRKSLIGAVLRKPPVERDWGTAATVACGIWAGANIVRVHEVAHMADVVRVAEAISGFGPAAVEGA